MQAVCCIWYDVKFAKRQQCSQHCCRILKNNCIRSKSTQEPTPRFRCKATHLHSPLCVIFAPNSGYMARYAPFIWHKSPTNCEIHLTDSIFQTRSRCRDRPQPQRISRMLRDSYHSGTDASSTRQLPLPAFPHEQKTQKITSVSPIPKPA